jgi:hypothetical protein
MSVHVFVFGARGLSAPLSGAALASWLIPGSRLPPQKERPFTQRPTSAASPRCPDDCPACRLASTPSAVVEPVPLPVRPWREVKSRRGARHPGEHRGVRPSQPAMLVLRHQRCSDPRSRWRWQAWQGRVHPDVSLSSLPHHVHSPAQHSFISPETPFPASRRGALGAGRGAGSFGGHAGLWLSTRHDHHLVDSRWRTRTNVAQAVLLPSAPATHPARRTPHQAAQPYAGAVALASHRSPHENSSCPACGSPHPKRSTSGDSLAATDADPRLSSALSE